MQISLILHIPEEQLKIALAKDGMTRDQFKELASSHLTGMGMDDLLPGATAELKITD